MRTLLIGLLLAVAVMLLCFPFAGCTLTVPLEPPDHDFTPLQLKWIQEHVR